jgi:hypothetical protein
MPAEIMDMDIEIEKKSKKVTFSPTITYYKTYSRKQYDRSSIRSTIYQRMRREITDFEWRKIFVDLNTYKSNEMIVHPSAKTNNSISKIPPII